MTNETAKDSNLELGDISIVWRPDLGEDTKGVAVATIKDEAICAEIVARYNSHTALIEAARAALNYIEWTQMPKTAAGKAAEPRNAEIAIAELRTALEKAKV